MAAVPRHTILCVASYFKGNRFLQRAKNEGCHVILLTLESKLQSPWAREHIDEVFALPSFSDLPAVIHAVAFLMRTRAIDRLVALDDFDVELGAALREHFRIAGMGQTTVRYFRDKLAMRQHAKAGGIRIPDYTPIFNHAVVRKFLEAVPAPWLLKPRMEASSIGIHKLHQADEVWRKIDELGDRQSFHLLERMVPGGELYHVDSLVADKRVVFAEVSKYHRPLLEVYQGGGIYATRTVPRDLPEVAQLREINSRLLMYFGMQRGCSHSEFLRSSVDGEFYFIETSARVGGANIAEMIEGARGLNLWEEWAKIEIDSDRPYVLPVLRDEHGGVTISLARQEHPDTSSFNDPEIFYRLDQKSHIGLVVRSPSSERVDALLANYIERIARDYHATLPPAATASA